jgi:hypothetical protein
MIKNSLNDNYRYLYTLIEHYLPPNSSFEQFLDVFGLSTNYDDKSQNCKIKQNNKI